MKIGKNWKIDNNSISTKLSKPFSNFASKLQYILKYFYAKNHEIMEKNWNWNKMLGHLVHLLDLEDLVHLQVLVVPQLSVPNALLMDDWHDFSKPWATTQFLLGAYGAFRKFPFARQKSLAVLILLPWTSPDERPTCPKPLGNLQVSEYKQEIHKNSININNHKIHEKLTK